MEPPLPPSLAAGDMADSALMPASSSDVSVTSAYSILTPTSLRAEGRTATVSGQTQQVLEAEAYELCRDCAPLPCPLPCEACRTLQALTVQQCLLA